MWAGFGFANHCKLEFYPTRAVNHFLWKSGRNHCSKGSVSSKAGFWNRRVGMLLMGALTRNRWNILRAPLCYATGARCQWLTLQQFVKKKLQNGRHCYAECNMLCRIVHWMYMSRWTADCPFTCKAMDGSLSHQHLFLLYASLYTLKCTATASNGVHVARQWTGDFMQFIGRNALMLIQ